MSRFDGKRLQPEVFKLDVERMRQGWYSDKYFANIGVILADLARREYRFDGVSPRLAHLGDRIRGIDTGNIEVEMQWFPRRRPFTVVAGVDKALAILRMCAGYFDDAGQFVSTYDQLEVFAAHDGDVAPFSGDPMEVHPVLVVRGRYADLATLETPMLGALTRCSRIATNVYEVLEAARGKPVLFFPARFDAHEIQAGDGYAYRIAVQLYAERHGREQQAFVSTDAQGDWWGGLGGGTVAHSFVACFLGDLSAAMLAFAETRPVAIPRIALVDFNNDCIGDATAVAAAMFARCIEHYERGEMEMAERYRLHGVRLDTSGDIRDVSVPPVGQPDLDFGVNPRLVFTMREALDGAWQSWSLPERRLGPARDFCKAVQIVATGGFNAERIHLFERLRVPVDIYGVGSCLLSNCGGCGTTTDLTADVVRVKVGGKWHPMAKVGRQACWNSQLEPVS